MEKQIRASTFIRTMVFSIVSSGLTLDIVILIHRLHTDPNPLIGSSLLLMNYFVNLSFLLLWHAGKSLLPDFYYKITHCGDARLKGTRVTHKEVVSVMWHTQKHTINLLKIITKTGWGWKPARPEERRFCLSARARMWNLRSFNNSYSKGTSRIIYEDFTFG